MVPLGQTITRERAAKKLTEKTLGEAAGLTEQQIIDIEASAIAPEVEQIFAIADALGTTLWGLMSERAPESETRGDNTQLKAS